MQPQINALPTNSLDLKDIHVPEQISNYPVAYGWWLLAAVIIFIIVITIIKIRKAAKRNQVKKQALAQLSVLLESNAQVSDSEIIALLKWAAMHYFSRAELAPMFGDSLKHFFISKLATKHQQNFAELSEQAFINQYQTTLTERNLPEQKAAPSNQKSHQAATLWLTHALPPKPVKVIRNNA